MNRDDARIRTLAVHAGESVDPTTRASAPNLVMSSTFHVSVGAIFLGTGVFLFGWLAGPPACPGGCDPVSTVPG